MEKKAIAEHSIRQKQQIMVGVAALLIGIITYYFSNLIISLIALISVIVLAFLISFFRQKLKIANDIATMELVFPEFLELMSSNLRAGMTIDKALLLSSREEFAPLDKEILQLGKDLVTGREIERALRDMGERINSEKIRKTLTLIITGMRSGGNLATLLQDTATNLRERAFIEKKAASNVLMYVIFVCFAVAVGAPVLFGLSAVLVETLTNIISTIPPLEQSTQLPFTLTQINVSPRFITYFSFVFLVVINALGSVVLGIVSKGDEKAGLRYIIPLTSVSIVIFLSVRFLLGRYFAAFFA